jgi:hypothetical protein
MGREEMEQLYFILGFFEGVSSSSLEMSFVKSMNVLLVMRFFLVVEDLVVA